MQKIYTYLAVMFGIMVLFYFAGLSTECCGADKICGNDDDDTFCENTGTHSIMLSLMLRPESMPMDVDEAPDGVAWWRRFRSLLGDISLATKVTLALSALAFVGSIGVGFLNRNPELAARSAVGAYLLVVGFDFILVYKRFASVNKDLAILLFAPLLVLYIIAVFDWTGKYG